MDIKQLIGETTYYDKKLALETKRPKSWCKSIIAFGILNRMKQMILQRIQKGLFIVTSMTHFQNLVVAVMLKVY